MSKQARREWVRTVLGVTHSSVTDEESGRATPATQRPPKPGGAETGATSAQHSKDARTRTGRRSSTPIELDPIEMRVPVAVIAVQGNTAAQEIDRYMARTREAISLMMSSFDRGLNKFAETIHGASEQETVPRTAQVAVNSLVRSALDAIVDRAVGQTPGIGSAASALVGPIRSAIEACISEVERASGAASRLATRIFITNIISAIDTGERQLLRSVIQFGDQLCQAVAQIVTTSDPQCAPGRHDAAFVGEVAGYVNLAKHLAEGFECRSSERNAQYFQQQISLAFANTPGYTQDGHPGRAWGPSMRPAGQFYLEIWLTLIGSFPDNYRWEGPRGSAGSSAWTLVTLRDSHDAETAADSLRESFSGTNPWAIPLPHQLRITVEADDRDLRGSGDVEFSDASSFDNPRFDPHALRGDVLRAAWQERSVREWVKSVTSIEGSNE